ncbi:MAG: ThuA domain-containing protein [Planctomycetes bacterium]|nr:ThuA domain-containing protein [Planctomycetota bacterium]MBU4398522.1 ThuA domain-containing protein [Planctomycetota bacterium]MCG2684810.1 ThuA domain-containing protein [Planctomycetales bacterium]
MNRSSKVRRILSMHPAHQTLGVSGTGAVFHPYCPIDGPATETIRVLLASHPSDSGASAALAALEPIVRRQLDMECERMDFDAVAGVGNGLPNVDCKVVFVRGLHVLGRGADFDAENLAEDCPNVLEGPSAELEISVAAPWHPVLDRVGAFVARAVPRRFGRVPEDATCLLVGKTSGGAHPVAWAREFQGRMFHTLLGAREDFHRPDFVQLVLNAIEWAGS